MRAPTRGKARNDKKTSASLTVLTVARSLGACAEGTRAERAMSAANMTTERPASDQASQEAARELIPLTPCSCSFALCVTTPLYSTTISQTLRYLLRASKKWIIFSPALVMYG